MSLFKISEKFVLNNLKNITQGNLKLINYDGKVFLFGDLESKLSSDIKVNNPNSPDQGSFQGRAIAINNDGQRVSASRQGVWSRDGYIYSFYSLDDVSDGNQFLCITTMNLKDDTVEMRFYPKWLVSKSFKVMLSADRKK